MMRPLDRRTFLQASGVSLALPLLARLGKHSRGAACLYVNKLADIDLDVLEEMIKLGWKRSFEKYPG